MRTLGGYRPLDSAFERIATPAPLLNEQQAGMLSTSSYSGYPLITVSYQVKRPNSLSATMRYESRRLLPMPNMAKIST